MNIFIFGRVFFKKKNPPFKWIGFFLKKSLSFKIVMFGLALGVGHWVSGIVPGLPFGYSFG